MTKIGCVCGNQISDTSDALPYKYRLIPDTKTHDLLDDIVHAAASDDADAHIASVFFQSGYVAYTCDKCDRLLVFDHSSDRAFAIYVRE